MRIVTYLRQSLDRESDGLAIERQRAECGRLCRSRGWDDVTEIIDNNKSASTGRRPGFLQIVELIERGAIDVVVILRIDRLMRRNDELEQLINLVEQHPVKIVTVEGDIEISTPQGRMVARVLVSVARNEIETKSARHRLANRQRAEAGLPHSSRIPYGYRDRMTLDPDEGPVVRRMGEMILSGHSYRDVAWWLNDSGHLSKGGHEWTSLTVRKLLENPRYAGIRRYDGQDFPAAWEPVFDPPTWQRLQAVMLSRRTGSPGDGSPAYARKYLLTGIAVCGKCGMHLSGHQKRDTLRDGRKGPLLPRYICRSWGDTKKAHGCGGIRRHAIPMDHFIREAIIFRLDSPELGEMLAADQGDDHELTKLVDIRQAQVNKINGLVDDYATGLLDREQLARAKNTAKSELDRINAQIAELGRSTHPSELISPGETVREAYMRNGLGWRRSLIQLLIDDITIVPSFKKPPYHADGELFRFDTSAVRINWKY